MILPGIPQGRKPPRPQVIVAPWAPFHSRALQDVAAQHFARHFKSVQPGNDASRIAASARYASELQRDNGRACDGCTLCCTLVPVQAVDKDAGHACVHQCATGCAIYSTRPQQCAAFLCNWALGHGPEEMKPDRCGVVFDFLPELGFIRANVDPATPDAWRQGIVRDYLRMLHAMGTTVQVVIQNGKEPPPAWGIPGLGRGNVDMRHPQTGETWCRFRPENLP